MIEGVYSISIDSTTPDPRCSTVSIESISLMNSEPVRASVVADATIRLFRHHVTAAATTISAINTAAIIAIPNYFTAADITKFIGHAYLDLLLNLRILKSSRPNRLVAILKFKASDDMARFVECFDGKQFNSMDPEVCHCVAIATVEVDENVAANPLLAPVIGGTPVAGTSIELPSCPVCLERLDSQVSGLVTIPCQHTFHCRCLTKWRDDSCPVCRYSSNPENNHVRHQLETPQEGSSHEVAESPDHCDDCDTTSDLWVCLICGKVGCSRYSPDRHSLEHFISTGHCFAMELSSSRVWDYAADSYVHRLVTDTEGKLVELDQKPVVTKSASDKAEAVSFEYSQLLISHLQSQRDHYEQLLRAQPSIVALRDRLTSKEKRVEELTALNEGLSQKVTYLEEQQAAVEKQKQDLQDQVTDLMFFLDTQNKCATDPEMQSATVVMQPRPQTNSSKSTKTKRKRK